MILSSTIIALAHKIFKNFMCHPPVRSQAIYQKLVKDFRLSDKSLVTGFIVDPEAGGPSVPFRMWGGLRDGDMCRLVTAETNIPAFLAPTPPEKIDPKVVDSVTIQWASVESEDGAARQEAIEKLVNGLKGQGLAFIEMTAMQAEKWNRAVEAALTFFALPEEAKLKCRNQAKDGKFVGYLSQPKREMFQVRRVGRESSFSWPQHSKEESGCEVDGAGVQEAFKGLYSMLDGVSRRVMREMCPSLGLEWNSVESMLTPGGDAGGFHLESGTGSGGTLSLGADVLRIFQLYRPAGSPLPGSFGA